MVVDLAPRPTSAAEARRIVARALRALDDETRDLAVLLASELVTNAVLYADGDIHLHIDPVEQRWRISVSDTSERTVAPKRVDNDATSGRGLALVERLSLAWGIDLRDGGKDVWFELPRA